ncbi:hypothetical protein THAOC_05398, partial [Thalassiosira oceanica]
RRAAWRGGDLVPLGIVLLGFAPRASTGLSQASIFGASLGGLAVNARARLPPDREGGIRPAADRLRRGALPGPPRDGRGGAGGDGAAGPAGLAPPGGGVGGTRGHGEEDGGEVRGDEGRGAEGGGDARHRGRWHDDGDGDPRRWLLEADARQYPPEKIASLALLWTGLAAVTVLRGAGPPAGLFDCGDAAFVALLLAQFAWTLGFAAYQGRRIVASAAAKVRAGYPFRDRDVRWDAAALRLYGAWTLLAGVVAGLVGIGGGMVLGPLMLAMNIDPRVSTATTGSELSSIARVVPLLHLSDPTSALDARESKTTPQRWSS